MCVSFLQQKMNGLPDDIIPTVLSFADVKQAHRCACINKQWGLHVQDRLIRIAEEAAQRRSQVGDYSY